MPIGYERYREGHSSWNGWPKALQQHNTDAAFCSWSKFRIGVQVPARHFQTLVKFKGFIRLQQHWSNKQEATSRPTEAGEKHTRFTISLQHPENCNTQAEKRQCRRSRRHCQETAGSWCHLLWPVSTLCSGLYIVLVSSLLRSIVLKLHTATGSSYPSFASSHC